MKQPNNINQVWFSQTTAIKFNLNTKSLLKYLIFAALGGLILYFIQKNFSFDEFYTTVQKSHLWLVLLSTLMGVFAVWLRGMRWQLILKSMGYPAKAANTYHATMSGYLVNLGIPRSGELSRCAMLSKSDQIPLNVLVGTVLSERIIDLLMLGLVVLTALAIQFDLLFSFINQTVLVHISWPKLILVGVVALIGLIVVFKLRIGSESKIMKMINGLLDGAKSVFQVKQPFLFIGLTFGIWMCYLLMTFCILMAFDFTQFLGLSGALSTLVFSTLGVIIPAPAGVATINSVYLGLSGIYQLPIAEAKAIGIVLFASNILMIILAGTISYIVMAKRTQL